MEPEVMKTVLQEILQELSGQREQLYEIQKEIEALNKANNEPVVNDSNANHLPVLLPDEQMLDIQNKIREHFEALRAETREHPMIHNSRHFTLLPLSFRMEHFPLLVDTVMKWIVALIFLFFCMWVIVRLMK